MRTRIRDKKKLPHITVEADTAAKAMRVVQDRLGPTPHVEVVKRVRRGGIGGFFAKERYLLQALREAPATVAPVVEADPVPAEIEAPQEPLVSGETDFGSALSAALFGVAEAEAEFVLESQPAQTGVGVLVADDPAPISVGPLAGGRNPAAAMLTGGHPLIKDPPVDMPHLDEITTAPEPAPADAPDWRLAGPAYPVPSQMGRVDWSAAALLRSGVPKVIVEAAAGLDERDDLGWINAMADALSPHCRELPDGATVFVGDDVERLAADLGIPMIEVMNPNLPTGSFATQVPDTPEALDWLAATLRERNLHLVIGGSGAWLHLLVDDPSGVSFTGDNAVVDALYVALTLGAPLGFGADGNAGLNRTAPIDAALAIRRLVGRQ